jgi:O-antigen ligase
MINTQTLYYQQSELAKQRFGIVIEGLYILYLLYTNMFIIYAFQINNLGVLMLGFTAVLVLFSTHPVRIFESTTITLSTLMTVFLFFVVGLAHGEFITKFFDSFVTLILSSIIFVFLIHRPGFLKRIIFLIYVLGVVSYANSEVNAFGRLEGGGNLRNPNSIAAWMGFACVGLAMWGFHARNLLEKIGTWGMMAHGLFIIGLTLSRGALLAMGISLIAFMIFYVPRSTSLVNIVLTLFIIGIGAGIFTQTPTYKSIAAGYEERWEQETGREELWPTALAQIRESPLLGYGSDGLVIATPSRVQSSHNPYLTIALVSGLFPAMLLAFQYVLGFFTMEKRYAVDNAFWLPALFIYAVIAMNFANWDFVRPWAVLMMVMAIEYRHNYTAEAAESSS